MFNESGYNLMPYKTHLFLVSSLSRQAKAAVVDRALCLQAEAQDGTIFFFSRAFNLGKQRHGNLLLPPAQVKDESCYILPLDLKVKWPV